MTESYADLMPVQKSWCFLNHATVAPLSQPAYDAIEEWGKDMLLNGDVHDNDFYDEIERIRIRCAELLNAKSNEIAFLKNTSEGLGLVAEGFPWKTGDSLVCVGNDFPANVYPWLHLQSRGVEVRQVMLEGKTLSEEAIFDAIDSTTKLLALSHVHFATGYRCDLERIGNYCRERNVDFCVDAIQSLGVFSVDLDALSIDYLSADGHKWLLSPEGASVFYVNEQKRDKIRPTGVGWKSVKEYSKYSTINYDLKQSADRYESGSLNVSGILGLGASVRMFQEVGMDVVLNNVRRLTDYLVERLSSTDAILHTDRSESCWSGIVSVEFPNIDAMALKAFCFDRNIIVACRDGRIRLSPHFYNTEAEIDQFVAAVQDFRQT